MEKVFAFDAPAFEIVKSYKDNNGQMFIEGIAATTGIDLTGERMSPEVLAKMASRLVGKPLRSEHGKGWDDKIGKIEQAEVKTDDLGQPALWIKARLNDWSSKARDLFAFLKDGTEKMGLSVAGKINPGGLVREMVESVGKYIPTYKDVEPTEVSITDHPANLETFAYAVAKSLHIAQDDIYDPDEYNKNRLAKLSDLIDLATAVQNDLAKATTKCQKCGSPLNDLGKCTKCIEMYDAPGTAQKDHECPNCEGELCEHDKCVNKDCSAEKCTKCYGMSKKDEDVTNASDKKPKEYADVAEGDFLDPENHKYPADEKHLMPALRYFNHDGQREAGGYDDAKWATMGSKLAGKLNKLTGDSYRYDPKSEKVVREAVKKEDEKEVNDEMNKHGNLVSKQIPDDIKGLLKSWGKDPVVEEAKLKGETVEKKADTVEKDSKPELFTPGGDSSSSSSGSSDSGSSSSGSSDSGSSDSSSGSSSSDSSTSSGSSDSGSSKDSEISSELSSLMSELKSTLEAMQSSLESSSSSSDSSSSDSSSSDSSSSGSDSSSSDGSSSSGSSDKTSTHKAVDASSTSSESSPDATSTDQDEVARAVDTLVQAANTMREVLAKAKSKNKPKLKDSDDEAASDYSTSDNVSGSVESSAARKAQPANGDDGKQIGAKPKLAAESSEESSDLSSSDNTSTNVGKALVQAISLMGEMQKSLAKRDEEFSKLVEKSDKETPTRKGYAWTLEKKFDGYHDAADNSGIDADLLNKIKNDKEVEFDEYYKAKHYGQLPKKYQTAKA